MNPHRTRGIPLVVIAQWGVLFVATLGVYANGFFHDFQFDSIPGILNNPHYSSFAYVPRYFVDPLTLTSVRENGDFRPILQITFAFNYWLSGLQMWSWHLVQVLLHFVCVLSVWFLCRRLLIEKEGGSQTALRRSMPFFAALVFALHPTGSGVVNYIWARSSLLVAALLLPSILLYMAPVHRPFSTGRLALSWFLFTLALFTKVEAISALAVYFFWEVINPSKSGPLSTPKTSRGLLRDALGALNLGTAARLGPFIATAALYLVIREQVVPDFLSESRSNRETTNLDYLATQLVACWHYLSQWLVPIHLVADDLSFPTYKGFLHAKVILSIIGWATVGVGTALAYRRHPKIVFLVLSAWALISPTSSVLPLAEMVNEHRPYLPRAFVWSALCVWIAGWNGNRPRFKALGLLAGLVVVLLAVSTWHRNKVFQTEESYWTDIYEKTESWRSAHNLGVIRMNQGRLEEARALLLKTLEQAPRWHYAHINLGIVHQKLGRNEEAGAYFNSAVANDPYSNLGRFYRAKFYSERNRFEEARADFMACLDDAHRRFEVQKGLARSHAGLRNWKQSAAHTMAAFETDPEQTENAAVWISRPYWLSKEHWEPGLNYFEAIEQFLPNRWWIEENKARLLQHLGRQTEAQQARRRANQLKRGITNP